MISRFFRAALRAAVLFILPAIVASAASAAQPSPSVPTVAQNKPTPKPALHPFSSSGSLRSYYFTRQNASVYNANAVNQASWNTGLSLHADYRPGPGPFWVGASYFVSEPFDGPCRNASAHGKGATFPAPGCVAQIAPSLNPDDSLPGYVMSALYEAYIAYRENGVRAKLGNQLFTSPWASPADTRLKPAAFSGLDVAYSSKTGLQFEIARMLQFEGRNSSAFSRETLLTSYPSGANGMAANLFVPGGNGLETGGFSYVAAGFAAKTKPFTLGAFFYNVNDLVNMTWLEGNYTWKTLRAAPVLSLQSGWESGAGRQLTGKIAASLLGAQIGAHLTTNLVLTAAYDSQPWRSDTVVLPKGVTCNNKTYQIAATGASLQYFLPINAAQCFTNPSGTTAIYYGGWASPYTDNYTSNPAFTTSISQGTPDRRAPSRSWKVGAAYTSSDGRWIVSTSAAKYDYGNALLAQTTSEWNADGQYHVNAFKAPTPYRGLLVRYRYAARTMTNTSSLNGMPLLGGLPLFKYNRAMLEYDF
ncbi:MAG: hypothetical protein NVS9B12_06190 [Vulcanimicrobiaceae bacterium]